ncbi:Endonuclease/exonuclease/phosphatase [Crepidotus variabilis]|uniref:Endonuclease/exonuclease/phosphatase n=1 Tax=Crepidotus variabilis TaxID=179855 RepID=A0A9P6ELB3_9AGAR|nr:Endonuclease/exonuclease/phosphatase [Crepidotus variabilis]
MVDDTKIRCVSLNCWGLKFVAKNLEQRIDYIIEELVKSDYDIIALQEIWVFAHYEKVQRAVTNRLPHSKFFYSGALGAGLAIFTRFPIIETGMQPYSLNGLPIDVAGGDWFVGKGAAHIVILHPLLGQVQIFNTHLFAKGGQPHQIVNAWEYARLARSAAEVGRFVIGLGDYNATPTELPITIIRDYAGLTDTWPVCYPNVNQNTITDPLEAVDRLGITADSPLNTWTAGKSYAQGTLGKRLDYVWYRQPNRPGQVIPIVRAIQSKVVLKDRCPGQNYSYSDHFGLEATLEIVAQTTDTHSHIPPTPSAAQSELSNASVSTAIQALTENYRTSTERSRKELTIFVLSLLVLLAVVVGTAWLPHAWINPIFILFTIFMSWLATTFLYQGFIFGNWERNALMNCIEDLEIYRKGQDILNGRRSP